VSWTIAELMSKVPLAFIPENAAGVEAVVHFKLTGAEAGEWNAVIKDGTCQVAQGIPHSRPTLTLSADSADLIQIATGKLDGPRAYMDGRIKITGDATAALKIIQLFKV
jgi:putative sterol carrier protein